MNNLIVYDSLHKVLTFFYSIVIKLLKKDAKFMGSLEFQKKLKSSDTVFILAPGSSINDYKEDDFNFISTFDSIGINNFIIHDFVPDIYLLETQNRNLNYFNIIKEQKSKFKNATFLYKGYASLSFKKLNNLIQNLSDKPSFLKNFYIAKDAYLKGEWSLINQQFYNMFFYNDYFYNYRSSLDYTILMAYKCGYKNVVLCGFDMTDRYFYSQNPSYAGITTKYNLCSNINTIHNDESRKNKIIELLLSMNIKLKEERGGGIFVYKKNMSLAEYLPLYSRNC